MAGKGGAGQADHMSPGPLQDWLIEADKTSTWTTSVCTGALILAGAGLLTGREATTHWLATGELERYGAKFRQERYVFDGKYVTAADVSAGIDMAIALVARIAGGETAQRCQLAIEYDPHPPFDGSPLTARPRPRPPKRARLRIRVRPGVPVRASGLVCERVRIRIWAREPCGPRPRLPSPAACPFAYSGSLPNTSIGASGPVA